MILESKKKFEVKYRMDPLWFLDFAKVTDEVSVRNGLSIIKDFCKAQEVDHVVAEETLHLFMNLIAKSAEFTKDQTPMQQVFQTLYYRWSLRRARQEKKDEEEGNIFKFQGEKDEDEEFKEMFPDYEEYLDINDNEKKASSATLLEEQYAKITESYINIFHTKNSLTIKEIITNGTDVAKKLLAFSAEFDSDTTRASTLSAIIDNLSKSIDVATITKNGSEVDFYRGSSPAELRRSVQIVEKLQHSVHSLLQQWPEHATLQTLFRISQEYLSFSVTTPVARLIDRKSVV